MMTNEDTIRAIEALGYSGREARFLRLVALHSGFFLRRQYREFAGTVAGRPDDLLVTRLINLNHGSFIAGKANTLVYHLSSRTFYRAIGQDDNRHRRMRTRFAIKAKLMALDYVLSHQDATFLATEEEKLEYFTGRLGIARENLPAKIYRSETSHSATTRYFVDKFPIAIPCEPDSCPPLVTFSYIDEGGIATPGFENWLGQYSRLFSSLDRFRIDYVTTNPDDFKRAGRTFCRLYGDPEGGPVRVDRVGIERLLTYFHLEDLFRKRDYGSITASNLEELSRLRKELASPANDELFEFWKAHEELALREKLGREGAPSPADHRFQLCELSSNYDIFGVPK